MKGAFNKTIHFLGKCGCKVLIAGSGIFKIQQFSEDEVSAGKVDISIFEEIKLIENLELKEFDKKGIFDLARSLGHVVIQRGV